MTLTWRSHPKAAWYRVRVEQMRQGKKPLIVVNHRLTAADLATACVDKVCTLDLTTLGVTLKDGKRYKWQVIVRRAGNKKLRSLRARFHVAVDPNAPLGSDLLDSPVPVERIQSGETRNLTFTQHFDRPSDTTPFEWWENEAIVGPSTNGIPTLQNGETWTYGSVDYGVIRAHLGNANGQIRLEVDLQLGEDFNKLYQVTNVHVGWIVSYRSYFLEGDEIEWFVQYRDAIGNVIHQTESCNVIHPGSPIPPAECYGFGDDVEGVRSVTAVIQTVGSVQNTSSNPNYEVYKRLMIDTVRITTDEILASCNVSSGSDLSATNTGDECTELPACAARTIQTLEDKPILIRDKPHGNVVDGIPPKTDIEVFGGWYYGDTEGGASLSWWWFTRFNNNEGYISASLVSDYSSCPKTLIEPPAPPVPAANSECYMKLTGVSAQVVDGSEYSNPLETITDTNLLIRVYGRSFEEVSERYLIGEPGSLPQKWVSTSLLKVAAPEFQYGCQPKVLGTFRYTVDANYWSIVGTHFDDFGAPVSFEDYPYTQFRNTQLYGGHHTGIDLVYGPPDGLGNATDFAVRAQNNGVVVEAGPSGITGRFIVENLIENPFGDRLGTWFENGSLFFAVTWFYDGDPLNDEIERPNTGYEYTQPAFGVRNDEIRLLSEASTFKINEQCNRLANWSQPEEPVMPPLPGCVDGPDRQIVIWYESDTNDAGKPDLQTVYYHTTVDQSPQYQSWKTLCSPDRNLTWEKVRNGDPEYAVCNVTKNTVLGEAKWLGWSSTPHLHYEVWIDRDHDGEFIRVPGGYTEREDPLAAFGTFR